MGHHHLKGAADCGCTDEFCPVCNCLEDICKVCGGERNTNWSSLPTHCPDAVMTGEQRAAVEARELDFRDGRWIDLCPPLDAAEVNALRNRNATDAEGFALIRLDHLRDDPPLCGLIVVRPDAPLTPPTVIHDAAVTNDGYGFLVVRHRPRDGLVPAMIATAHDIDNFLPRFLAKHGCDEIEVREVIGTGANMFVHVYRVPVTVITERESAQAAE